MDPKSATLDELIVEGQKQVIWYHGLDPYCRVIHKVYSVDTPVVQAFWCHFSEGEDSVAVCIQEESCLGVYMETGAVHYASFPFQVSLVYSSRHHCFLAYMVCVSVGGETMAPD